MESEPVERMIIETEDAGDGLSKVAVSGIIAFPGTTGGKKVPFIVDDMAPQDERKTKVFNVLEGSVEITYFRNRITLEGDIGEEKFAEDGTPLDSDEVSQLAVARRLCNLVASWDIEGPVKNSRGETVVERGQIVPLDPQVVRLFPMRVTRAINQAIYGEELGGNDENRRKQ